MKLLGMYILFLHVVGVYELLWVECRKKLNHSTWLCTVEIKCVYYLQPFINYSSSLTKKIHNNESFYSHENQTK